MATIPHTALALLEKPDVFVLHRRPNLSGKLVYPGMLHFFGGGIEAGETPYEAMVRELGEETNLRIPSEPIGPVRWKGRYMGQNLAGAPAPRDVVLMGLPELLAPEVRVVPSETEGGETVEVPKDPAVIAALEKEMAPFTYEALLSYVTSGRVRIGET